MATYWELLKHPQWQRKRLEVLTRSNFSCENCGATDKTLNVHHSYYEKGKKPWEYQADTLQSLCEDCHKDAQDWMTLLHRQIGSMPLDEQEELYGVALGMAAERLNDGAPIGVASYGVAVGLARHFGTNAGFLIDLTVDGMLSVEGLRQKIWDATVYKTERP